MDDEGAAFIATEMLQDFGHKRIGFIAGSEEYNLTQWRIDGWTNAMQGAGLPVGGLLARGDFSYESGAVAARQLLAQDDPPTAIIAGNDQMTLAALDVAREKGLSVPEDLSLVSFDNTPVVRMTRPPLTAIDQPIAEVVSEAAEMLIAAQKDAEPPIEPVVIPASLVERGSTAAPGGGARE
jgi:LacI family transcriptional regulator